MRNENLKIDLDATKNLVGEHRETLLKIFRLAVRSALLDHKRAGNPIAVSRGGEVVWIQPEDIVIDEEENA